MYALYNISISICMHVLMLYVCTFQHILRDHTTFFANTCGSLNIWSSQGMEKSHWQARATFHRNTQHGGTTGKKSYIIQLFQWFYRRVHIRKITKSSDYDKFRKACKFIEQKNR